jgi:phosphoribosylaminoimidazolecarboxamide formyltransferase/IMP cyclohydrolase
MLRAAAKNYRFTSVLCDPSQYGRIMDEISEKGAISKETSRELSRAVFNHTASYDAMIASYLNGEAHDEFPETLTLTYKKIQPLRYGENPHQGAAFYRSALEIERERVSGIPGTQQLQGKELSYNNMLDFSAALMACVSLPEHGAVIVKHLNPCGAAIVHDQKGIHDAFLKARACDPVSAFGGVIAVNGVCDGVTAGSITENFVEGVIAQDFTGEALELFAAKKNVRLIRIADPDRFLAKTKEIRQVHDGILYQDGDTATGDPSEWRVVTEREPDEREYRGLMLAWRLVKHVKSNAIVFCSEDRSLGIGAGQMSRVDAVEIAAMKAAKNGIGLEGSSVGSDAFFPFRDNIDVLAKAGAKAVIQPGGSVRDEEVIRAANEYGIAMIFTGMRHFRH